MTTQRTPGVSIFPFCTSELGFLSTELARKCVGCDFVYEAGLVANESGRAPNFCNPNVSVFPLPLGECSLCNKSLIDGCLAFLMIMCICTVVLNAWSLAVWFTVKPKRPQVFFKLSLTTSDFLFGLIVLPEAAYHMITTMYVGHEEFYDFEKLLRSPAEFNSGWAKYFSPLHLKFSIAMLHITQGASLCSILLLSIDRHLAITKNIRYPSIMTKSRCLLMIFVTWLGLALFTIIISFTAVNNWLFTVSPSVFFLPLSEPPDSVDTQTYADPTFFYFIPLGVVFVAIWGVTLATSCALRRPVSANRRASRRKLTMFVSDGESERTVTTSPIAMATFEFTTSTATQQDSSSDDSPTKDVEPGGADLKLPVPQKSARSSVNSGRVPLEDRNLWKRMYGKVFGAEENQTCDAEHRKANRTLILILLVYTVCVLPFASLMFYNLFDDDLADKTSSDGHLLRDHRSVGKMITVGIFLTSSIWNCVIYSVRNRDFRYATRALVKRLKSSLQRYM